MTSIYMKQRAAKTSEHAVADESISKLIQNIRFLEDKKGFTQSVSEGSS